MSKVVGIMGSGTQEWQPYSALSGQLVASMGHSLLTGGGRGVMEAASRAFLESPRNGVSIGVVPTVAEGDSFKIKDGYPNRYIEICIASPLGVFDGVDPDQISRNHINILSSDFIVALPGAKGTRNEIELAHKLNKPLILFGPIDYWPQSIKGERTDSIDIVRAAILSHLANPIEDSNIPRNASLPASEVASSN